MLDTLGSHSHYRNAEDCIQYLSRVRDKTNREDGHTTTTGFLGNMFVEIDGNHVSVNGSLPKYFLDNNLQQLSTENIKQATEKLSDNLHLNIDDSKVYRFDIAANFMMNYNPSHYFNSLDRLNRFQKKPYKNTGVLFTTGKTTLAFYDKTKELKKRDRQKMPEQWRDKNVLRYELRFQKRIPAQFSQEVFVRNIYDEDFLILAVDKWREYFFKIEKSNPIIINPKISGMYNIPQMKNIAWYKDIIKRFGNIETYYRFLDAEQKRGVISRQFKSNVKKQIRHWSELPEFHIEDTESMKELNNKVNGASLYLQQIKVA